MATDATGAPTSPDLIPTYNTSVDAPSGLGFNAAMTQIQVALIAKVGKPSGIVTGETVVYNGTAFVRSSVTNLSVSSLAPGSNTQVLTTTGGVPVWAAPAGSTIGYAVTLPGGPTDGLEAVLVDSITLPTYQWRFRWNNGSSNTDKWEFIGGAPVIKEVAGTSLTPGTTYVDVAGATFTVPRAGVYQAAYSGSQQNVAGGATAHTSLKKGSAAIADADSINVAAQVNQSSGSRAQTVTGLAASDTLKLQTKVTSGSFNLTASMAVTPVRVS